MGVERNVASSVAPPIIKIGPPPASGKQPPAYVKFVNTYSKKYPGLKQWSAQILAYAREAHIDPVYFASVILTESGANSKTGDSKAGAIGLGQIMPLHIGESVPWDPSGRSKVTEADLRNPVFNLRWSAHYLATAVGNYGYQGAYSQGYNPGWTPASGGTDPLSRIPKGYLPGVSTPGVSGAAGAGVATGPAGNPSKDPWVVVTPNGGLKTVTSAQPPKNVVTDAHGDPYTLSQFNVSAHSLDTIYLAYTGAKASPKIVAAWLKNQISGSEITMRLSDPKNNPRFYKSPIWLTHHLDYESVYKSVYGNDANVNDPAVKKMITQGVVRNLSQAAFTQQLRNLPTYTKSEEYKGAAAQFRTGYEQIYGTPDQAGEQHIDAAVRQGWNGDQWTQFLRAQPEYTSSGEFQRNAQALMARLGFNAPGMTSPLTSAGPQAPSPAPSLTATGSAPVG